MFKVEDEIIKDVKVNPSLRVVELIEIYRDIHGFTASSLYRSAEILREMILKSDLRFLSFTGNIIATGLRGIIAQLIDEKIFNVVITTCGAIDHDIARSLDPKGYMKGYFEADDIMLISKNLHRLGNIFIKMESYGPAIERFTHSLIDEIISIKKRWGVREILKEAGRRLAEDPNSILGAAYRSNVPIYVPGIVDGAFGTALFTKSKISRFELDLFSDMSELADMVFRARSSGALILGGGISKHHTIWWNQFREGLDYAVYVTTAQEYDGSLSGARTREAISWGKIKPQGKHEVIIGEVSVILPILASYILSISNSRS
ncbi:MAG: deoxyhypusine synthase [Sulfolobales archaeon]